MMRTEVVLERETANDETALVVAIHVRSGELVAKDDILFDIENSKATQELVAPIAGLLTHALTLGDTVEFGISLAHILPAGEPGPGPVAPLPAHLPPPPTPTRPPASEIVLAGHGRGPAVKLVSHEASALAQRYGIDLAGIAAEFVTSADIRALLHPGAADHEDIARLRLPEARPAVGGELVGGRKRAEIEALSAGAGLTMLSVLGTALGNVQVAREPGDFLAGRLTDIVIYEAARLMRKYPNLNARYEGGQVIRSEDVHAGLAIDGGGQLVVYGIEHADRIDLPQIGQAIAEAVGRYVENRLTAAEMTRATFTVTDLSDLPVDFVFPLLPKGQSCILGITRSETEGYRVFAGFDHRVTEGREVALFLGELRQRLQSFGQRQAGPGSLPVCAYCDRSVAEAVAVSADKGLLKVVDRHGREVFCCASCWNGW